MFIGFMFILLGFLLEGILFLITSIITIIFFISDKIWDYKKDERKNKKNIQESFDFLYEFIECIFMGYYLDYTTVIDNIMEIREKRSEYRRYFDMIFSPLEIDDTDPNPIDCCIQLLSGKYKLRFFVDPYNKGTFSTGGNLQISIKNDNGGSKIWDNMDQDDPSEFLNKIWVEIIKYVKIGLKYEIKIPIEKKDADFFKNLNDRPNKGSDRNDDDVKELLTQLEKDFGHVYEYAMGNKDINLSSMAMPFYTAFYSRNPVLFNKLGIEVVPTGRTDIFKLRFFNTFLIDFGTGARLYNEKTNEGLKTKAEYDQVLEEIKNQAKEV